MLDTEIEVIVNDSDGDPVNEADIKVYAKQPGFSKYIVYEEETSRLGKATVYSGAHFGGTDVLIEVSKEDYETTTLQLTVSGDVVVANPSTLSVSLNTVTKREEDQTVSFGNATKQTVVLNSISLDADLEGLINEGALQGYFTQVEGLEIAAEDTEDIPLLRIRINNSITTDTMLEPINITGDLVVTFLVKGTGVLYTTTIPITIDVTSDANPTAKCLIISGATGNEVTERGRVNFYFELQNACASQQDNVDIGVDELYVKLDGDVKGTTELSLQSSSRSQGGRTALDGLERKVFSGLKPGEVRELKSNDLAKIFNLKKTVDKKSSV
jgi:hypothetical protein